MQGPEKRTSRSDPKELSLIVLISGCVLLLPPGALLYRLDGKIGGIPITLLVLCFIWMALIIAGALVSRALGRSQEAHEEPDR